MLLIRYQGRVSAVVRPNAVQLLPHIDALEGDHPERRWVFCLSLFALDVLDRRIQGPYTDFRAALFARHALIPDGEFGALQDCDDAELAEHFNVPLAQILEKRADLEALTWL